MVEIDDVAALECPVSIASRMPHIEALVTDVLGADLVHEATGAYPFGPDTTKWPARWHDAVRIAETEKRRIEVAKIRSETR